MYIIVNILKQTNTSVNNMASIQEPIVVLYKSKMCRHCTSLANIWETNADGDSVTSVLKKVNPKLRFATVTANDNTGKFDENTYPKDLSRFSKWFPMVLLIPGPLWNQAMSKLGPKNDVKFFDGVQILNGNWHGETFDYVQKYDIRKPGDFGDWLRESMNNDNFKRVQNGTASSIVPTIQTPSQPIQPILSNISKPANTATTYAGAGSSDRHSSMEPGDVCSMRIISRPR